MSRTILSREHPVLRSVAEDIPVEDIASARITRAIRDMKEALAREKDGMALAAPQVGIPLRLFVVSPEAFRIHEEERVRNGEKTTRESKAQKLVYINPRIVKTSKRKLWMPEGCLSVRWLYGRVKRADKVSIEAYDEYGKKFSRGGSGLIAQIFQHEIDHLDGILFTDKAKDLEEMHPEEKTPENGQRKHP